MKKRNISFEELQAMTDEEVRELNKELAVQAVKRYVGFQIAKWIIIMGAVQATKKAVEWYLDRGKVH